MEEYVKIERKEYDNLKEDLRIANDQIDAIESGSSAIFLPYEHEMFYTLSRSKIITKDETVKILNEEIKRLEKGLNWEISVRNEKRSDLIKEYKAKRRRYIIVSLVVESILLSLIVLQYVKS